MLDIRLGCASICKRVVGHIHWEFFLAPQHFFSFWTVCVSLTEAIFSFNFWETASIVSLSEAKNGFIFGINFWLHEFGAKIIFFGVCGR